MAKFWSQQRVSSHMYPPPVYTLHRPLTYGPFWVPSRRVLLTGPSGCDRIVHMSENSALPPTLPALTSTDHSFALCIIEYGGNLGAAYRAAFGAESTNPVAKAREMLLRPEVAKRILELTMAVEESALISLGSHLTQLAEIRDLGIKTNQLKVALSAEVQRGEAAGYYSNVIRKDSRTPAGPSVTINIGTTPSDVKTWASRHGSPPVVIDV